MDSDYKAQLNDFLVHVFNEILRTEENCLKTEEFSNISVREMHVIEAVCAANKPGQNNRASDIAQAQGVSAGTLTTAVSQLEKKGCLMRRQDPIDKRIVRLYPTEKGRRANDVHQLFHRQMVDDVLAALSPDEIISLVKGLKSLQTFFDSRK